MKRPRLKPPPNAIPRSVSLYYKLQQNPGPKDQPYLDQLLIFLENPPKGVRNRWEKGAKMCAEWGISCTSASVWRFYRSHVLEWRLRLSREAGEVMNSSESLGQKTARMAAARAFEVLSHPDTPTPSLVELARLEFRKKELEFARQKHRDKQATRLNQALNSLADQIQGNEQAFRIWEQLRDCLCLDSDDEPATPLAESSSLHSVGSPGSAISDKNNEPNSPESRPKQGC